MRGMWRCTWDLELCPDCQIQGDILLVGDGYTDFVVPHRIEDFESLAHGDEFARIVEVHERSTELSSLHVNPLP